MPLLVILWGKKTHSFLAAITVKSACISALVRPYDGLQNEREADYGGDRDYNAHEGATLLPVSCFHGKARGTNLLLFLGLYHAPLRLGGLKEGRSASADGLLRRIQFLLVSEVGPEEPVVERGWLFGLVLMSVWLDSGRILQIIHLVTASIAASAAIVLIILFFILTALIMIRKEWLL